VGLRRFDKALVSTRAEEFQRWSGHIHYRGCRVWNSGLVVNFTRYVFPRLGSVNLNGVRHDGCLVWNFLLARRTTYAGRTTLYGETHGTAGTIVNFGTDPKSEAGSLFSPAFLFYRLFGSGNIFSIIKALNKPIAAPVKMSLSQWTPTKTLAIPMAEIIPKDHQTGFKLQLFCLAKSLNSVSWASMDKICLSSFSVDLRQ